MAHAGVASRRACETLIDAGRVTVNGKIVSALPAWVDPTSDRIAVDGKPIRTAPRLGREPATGQLRSQRPIYVALHKPRGVVSTTNDPEGRRCVLDLVDLPMSSAMRRNPRLYPVGRLDADSSGLILLTNDGALTQRLTHPRYGVAKRYLVSVRGRLSADDIAAMRRGIRLTAHPKQAIQHGLEPPPRVKVASASAVRLVRYDHDKTHGDRTNLEITLREGQNREIRRMLAKLGFKVRRLKRVGIGPLSIKGLGVGGWRLVTSQEVNRLKRACGGRG